MKNREEEIRQICTYHSDGGTSGYNLSEEQFQKLFNLLASQEKTIRQEVAEDVETYLSSSAPIHGISFKEFTRLKSKYLSEQKREKGSK